jgi:hypothetical protein
MVDVGVFHGVHFHKSADRPLIFFHDRNDAAIMNKSIEKIPREVGVGKIRKWNKSVESVRRIGSCTRTCRGGEFDGVGRPSPNSRLMSVDFFDGTWGGAEEHYFCVGEGCKGVGVL